MINTKLVFAAAAVLAASAAHAQIGVTADIGTTGVGTHLVIPMEKTLNGRFGVNFLRYTGDERAGSAKYDTKTTMRTVDALFDWYAFNGSPLYLTAGVIYNGSKITARAVSDNGTFTLNKNVYQELDVGYLTGKVEYHKAAPYLGIGWGNPLNTKKSWNLSGDLGAIYQGATNSQLAAIGCRTSAIVCTTLARDVAAEKPLFQAGMDTHKVYPVLRVSASYNF